jgi:REP element-mobilizing transposase RayT
MAHQPPLWVETGAVFFVTVCCEQRGTNQLCIAPTAKILLDAAAHYHERQDWFLRQMLLMPDHVHALLAPAPEKSLAALVGLWKRYTAGHAQVRWQKNFFDHRLRSGESWQQKSDYIRTNPVRAGLCREDETWPYQLNF